MFYCFLRISNFLSPPLSIEILNLARATKNTNVQSSQIFLVLLTLKALQPPFIPPPGKGKFTFTLPSGLILKAPPVPLFHGIHLSIVTSTDTSLLFLFSTFATK